MLVWLHLACDDDIQVSFDSVDKAYDFAFLVLCLGGDIHASRDQVMHANEPVEIGSTGNMQVLVCPSPIDTTEKHMHQGKLRTMSSLHAMKQVNELFLEGLI